MSDKDLTHLIERLCNPGADLSVAAFEAADELFYQAAEIERLRAAVLGHETNCMTKADNILKLAHAYAIKGEYEPFRAAVELLAADAARTDELQLVANLLNEYGLQALDVVAAFKTAPPRTALTRESMEALRELVACEDMRLEVQSIRSDPYYITEADAMELKYEQRRDKAWDRARAVIAASGEPK